MSPQTDQAAPALAVLTATAGRSLVGIYSDQVEPARARFRAFRGRPVLTADPEAAAALLVARAIAGLLVAGRPVWREPNIMRPRTWAYERQAVGVVARPTGRDGSLVLRGDADSLTLRIYEVGAADQLVYEEELDPDAVLLLALQLDGRWNLDDLGYTFLHELEPDQVAMSSGRVYRLEYSIETSEWGVIAVDGEISVRARSSTS